jgi:hypothetical protein
MMIHKIECLLFSSKIVGSDSWQENNSKGFKKRLRNCLFNLLVIHNVFVYGLRDHMITRFASLWINCKWVSYKST